MMWLRDRFNITVELADAEVETVIREVLLRKKPSAEPEIESVLEANAGEIARHLQGTKIGEKTEDPTERRLIVGGDEFCSDAPNGNLRSLRFQAGD